MLNTYKMVVAAISVTYKANQVRFFEEIFLVANVSLKIVFWIFFPNLSDADIDIFNWELRWIIYNTKETLPTTRHVKLVKKKKFAAIALDSKHETFVTYVTSLSSAPLNIYPLYKP